MKYIGFSAQFFFPQAAVRRGWLRLCVSVPSFFHGFASESDLQQSQFLQAAVRRGPCASGTSFFHDFASESKPSTILVPFNSSDKNPNFLLYAPFPLSNRIINYKGTHTPSQKLIKQNLILRTINETVSVS